MRDIQEAIRAFYDATTGFVAADDLAWPARSAIAAVQVLNDLLTNQFSGREAYASRLAASTLDAETVLGFKYLRNVVQHIIHPVEPVPDSSVGGVGLGYRTFTTWAAVPTSVDEQLQPRTRSLRPHYETRLEGQPVTQTLLRAASFFASVVPDVVHRQANGEWAGFPLRHQPDVRAQLHPHEPQDEHAAVAWMNGRRPGGDCRVVCGSFCSGESGILYGVTFLGRCVMTPFFETPDQVRADIARDYRYHHAAIGEHVRPGRLNDRTAAFDEVLCSSTELHSWMGTALREEPEATGHCQFGDPGHWRSMMSLETVSGT